jgi:hypothetical protein
MFIKPKDGLKIRRPDNKKFLAIEGEEVPKNSFWLRRILDGDVYEPQKVSEKKVEVSKEKKVSKDKGEK